VRLPAAKHGDGARRSAGALSAAGRKGNARAHSRPPECKSFGRIFFLRWTTNIYLQNKVAEFAAIVRDGECLLCKGAVSDAPLTAALLVHFAESLQNPANAAVWVPWTLPSAASTRVFVYAAREGDFSLLYISKHENAFEAIHLHATNTLRVSLPFFFWLFV
jgi:hypothetical protein